MGGRICSCEILAALVLIQSCNLVFVETACEMDHRSIIQPTFLSLLAVLLSYNVFISVVLFCRLYLKAACNEI